MRTDRKEISIGAKIKDAKLTGITYILVLGKCLDEGFVEIENIKTGEKIKVFKNDIVERCEMF